MNRSALARLSLTLALLSGSPAAHAIVGGAGADPNTTDSPWAGVGSITIRNGGIYSGALISRRHVLTAAHAVAGNPGPRADITFNLNFGADLSHRFHARSVHVLPRFQGAHPGPDGIWYGDMAVVELDGEVPANVPVYQLYTQPALRLPRESTLMLVGYGAHGDGFGAPLDDPDPSVKRIGRNSPDAFIGRQGEKDMPEVFVFDFDGPTADTNVFPALPDSAAHPLEAEAGFAGGDSGSPVFIMQDNVWKILGIATFNAQTSASYGSSVKYGAIEGGTFVAPYRGWIESVLDAAPAEAANATAREPSRRRLAEAGIGAAVLACIGAMLGFLRRAGRRS